MTNFDVWRSRPLDVHRWSSHPEINAVVGKVFDSLTTEQQSSISGKSKNVGRASGKDHLKVLLVDLYVAWKTDPDLCLGIARGHAAFSVNSRYNALHISSRMSKLVDVLHEAGFIDFSAGSYNRQGTKKGNRTSRIKAEPKLIDLFEACPAQVFDVELHRKQECIILTDDIQNDDDETVRDKVEYQDTPETRAMRCRLDHYNEFLSETYIDIPSLTDPWLIRKKKNGDEQHIPIGQTNKFVRRIFSRGSWDLNGRFYGGWWQHIDKHLRKEIAINDTPTVEVDYKGLHVAMLSALRDQPANVGDRYELKKHILTNFTKQDQRKIVKLLILTAINARDTQTTYQAFRADQPTGTLEKKLKDAQLSLLLEAFIDENKHLRDDLCSDMGIKLMNLDGQITDKIIKSFTNHQRPILSVHDSYIVRTYDVGDLATAMAKASKEVVGQDLSFEQLVPSYANLASMRVTDRDRYLDTFKEVLSFKNRTKEYEERVLKFKEYRKSNFEHTYWLR